MRHYVSRLASAIVALVYASTSGVSAFETPIPRVMLWSWQKIEDLRSVDGKNVGVAFLVGRFTVDGHKVNCQPRLSRLQLPVGCYREAVARVEVKSLPPEEKQSEVSAELSEKIADLAMRSKVNAVQIDFDARQNQRQFYLHLLRDLQKALPQGMTLSTTALASWSQGDTWLKDAVDQKQNINIDHVVPMFFTMGAGHSKALQLLKSQLPLTFNNKLAIGLSLTDSAAIGVVAQRLSRFNHIYLFCSPGWSRESLNEAGKLIDIKLTEENKIGHI